ncbi:hypothetical protein M9H77_30823 [Catharanthus roseus]|uniref:Uncharacterized protein n=1 Tax=Catharanthus roseus TaxID=4058 RepID=A0ACB9ZYQ3_CATRO|nr:hypothetical protein M9H77_30823 [Catharanthus roseus]
MDLGKDFFLVNFQKSENNNKALHEGPLFIGQHFLAVQKWEAKFKASEASFTITGILARLPELPTEFYDCHNHTIIVTKIGNVLEPFCELMHVYLAPPEDNMLDYVSKIGHKAPNCPHQIVNLSNKTLTESSRSSNSLTEVGPWMVVQ